MKLTTTWSLETVEQFKAGPPTHPWPKGSLLKDKLKKIEPTPIQRIALRFARGIYQRALILDLMAWSDLGLSGSARSYARRYGRSRRNLLDRLEAAKIAYLRTGPHGRYEFVYGTPEPDMVKTMGKYHQVWRKKESLTEWQLKNLEK